MDLSCPATQKIRAWSCLAIECPVCERVSVTVVAGITMRAYKRLQMSSRIGKLGSVLEPKVSGDLVIPMFWAEETAQAPADLAQQFKATVYRAQWFERNLGKLSWILGGCFVLFGIILAVVTVELGADPEKWAPTSHAAAIAAARDMFTVQPTADEETGVQTAEATTSEVQVRPTTTDDSSLAAEAVDLERQRLLPPGRQEAST